METRINKIVEQAMASIREYESTMRAWRRMIIDDPTWAREQIRRAVAASPETGGIVITARGVPNSYDYPAKTSQATIAWDGDRLAVRVERVRAKTGKAGREPSATVLDPGDAREILDE